MGEVFALAGLLRAFHRWVHCYFAVLYYFQFAGPIFFAIGAQFDAVGAGWQVQCCGGLSDEVRVHLNFRACWVGGDR